MTAPAQPSNNPLRSPDMKRLKAYLINNISRELEANPPLLQQRREVITQQLNQSYVDTKAQLPNSIRDQLFHEILDDLLGFGPIQSLLDDPDITEVMVNG